MARSAGWVRELARACGGGHPGRQPQLVARFGERRWHACRSQQRRTCGGRHHRRVRRRRSRRLARAAGGGDADDDYGAARRRPAGRRPPCGCHLGTGAAAGRANARGHRADGADAGPRQWARPARRVRCDDHAVELRGQLPAALHGAGHHGRGVAAAHAARSEGRLGYVRSASSLTNESLSAYCAPKAR